MRKVPKGKLITINQIKQRLAKKHKATIGCLITTGIFAKISADDFRLGKKNITLYWWTVKESGVIKEKYPAGVESIKKVLR